MREGNKECLPHPFTAFRLQLILCIIKRNYKEERKPWQVKKRILQLKRTQIIVIHLKLLD